MTLAPHGVRNLIQPQEYIMAITNTHPETGIRYTVFAVNNLDGDVVHELLYTHGTDLSYNSAVVDETERQTQAWQDECDDLAARCAEDGTDYVPPELELDLENFDPMIDEPTIEGEYQGVKYRTTWLGGGQLLWVFESPIVGRFRLCSPCVPGAANGDQPDEDGYEGYDIPADWKGDDL